MTQERQIKYLGLIIEKDDEQLVDAEDADMYYRFRSMRQELRAFEAGWASVEDDCYMQRQYLPIRDKYIRIVKRSRRLAVESMEKRGGKDFKRTRQALMQIAMQERTAYMKQRRLEQRRRFE